MKASKLLILAWLVNLLAVGVQAAEPKDKLTQGMIITGDQELPQVLYIQPWQPQTPKVPPSPVRRSLLQQPMTPCDSGLPLTEFQQQVWHCPESAKQQP